MRFRKFHILALDATSAANENEYIIEFFITQEVSDIFSKNTLIFKVFSNL